MPPRHGRAWPGGGACAFPFDPDAAPRAAPALWQPELSPQIIQIEAAVVDLVSLGSCGFAILAQHRKPDRCHVVLGRQAHRERLCIQLAPTRTAASIILVHDDMLALRARAVAAYAQLSQRPHADPATRPVPGAYQRAALIRLVQIADALACGATSRDIAYSIVFPRHQPVSGATWKGSSERRHCWRLIQKARWYLRDGYRHLLSRG